MNYPTEKELQAGLDWIRQSPSDQGVLEMIVRRPKPDRREVLQQAELSVVEGLIGDVWGQQAATLATGSTMHGDCQLTVMNARAISLVAHEKARWALAGDQLYADLNLSEENLPAGSRLSVGSAVIQITSQPHNGCRKFSQRFGTAALKFVNSPVGKQLHLRGIYAKVIQPGTIQQGDAVKKL